MSMTLSGMKRTLCVGHGSWSQTLITAFDNGWKPMGTLPPIYEQDSLDWSSENYTSNDSQLVVEEDAANLADALERALPSIVDDDDRPFIQDMIGFCRKVDSGSIDLKKRPTD